MTNLRRNLFRFWIFVTMLWLACWAWVVAEYGDYHIRMFPDYHIRIFPDHYIYVAAFAIVLPVVIFIIGVGLVWAWERLGEVHWMRLPENLRRGLLRLFLVVTVPWVAWIGYHILDALNRRRPVSGFVWSLLIVPIGGPILVLVIVWVVAGFRSSAVETNQATIPNRRSTDDYYALIARAVSGLDTAPDARQTQYDRARAALATQLTGLDLSRERATLEAAIRRLETDVQIKESKRIRELQILRRRSTALLITSMLFPGVWAIDFTSMSLYWVARPPQVV